jgi:sodium-dependent dicarboxylate transporter 2/3/5
MADSRRAAERLVNRMQHIVEAQQRVIYFLVSIISAFLITYYITLHETSFTQIQQYVLFILLFAVALWMSEAIPPFAVGILIVGLLIFLLGQAGENQVGDPNYIDVSRFADTWSNSVIWLMLGGFFLAAGLKKTGLDKRLFQFSISYAGSNPKMILLSLMLVTALASMVMSNTATTAMMIASITPFIEKNGAQKNISKVLLIGVPAAASIGGMGTIIGSPPNVIAVDAINQFISAKLISFPYKIGFLEWMVVGVPLAFVLVVIFWRMLIQRFKLEEEEVNFVSQSPKKPTSTIGKFQQRVVLGVLIVTVLFWLTGNIHGIPAAAISGIPIIILPMVSIITGDDVRELPWDTLMLVAGGLSIGLAITESGLAGFFVEKLKHLSFNGYLMMFTFSMVTVLLSNIMSNTATATILIPVASIIPGVDPVSMAVLIGLSASCALFLPVSSPPNAIAFSTGYLKQSDFRFGGFLVGLLGPFLAIIWVLLLKWMLI